MKKIFALAVLLFLLIIPAQAVMYEKGYISVSTSANTEIAPDVAEISIAIVTYDSKSLQNATGENKKISENVINALKTMINPNKGDYLKTSDYNASPLYSYSGSKRTFDKYQVSNTVIVHTKSIDKVGEIIDKSIVLGATNINNLSFSVSNYEKQCNELLSVAVDKAQKRVQAVSKAANATIDGIRSMDVSCSANNSYRPQMLMANKMISGAEADSAVSTTIETGVVKIFANLNASYFVK